MALEAHFVALRSYGFGPFRLDLVRQQLWEGEVHRSLAPKAYDLLLFLLERPGALLTKQELLDGLWPDVAVGDAVLKVQISELRKALGESAAKPRYVETVHRKGYRFLADGQKMDAAEAIPDDELPEALAVLPFESRGEGDAHDYLAEGLAEELCGRLSAQGRLPVIAWGSSAALALDDSEPRSWGRRLGARHLVRGSVRRAGDRIRLRAQLLDARTGQQRWGDRFDRPVTDVLQVEDEIAESVARAVGSEPFEPAPEKRARLDAAGVDA